MLQYTTAELLQVLKWHTRKLNETKSLCTLCIMVLREIDLQISGQLSSLCNGHAIKRY